MIDQALWKYHVVVRFLLINLLAHIHTRLLLVYIWDCVISKEPSDCSLPSLTKTLCSLNLASFEDKYYSIYLPLEFPWQQPTPHRSLYTAVGRDAILQEYRIQVIACRWWSEVVAILPGEVCDKVSSLEMDGCSCRSRAAFKGNEWPNATPLRVLMAVGTMDRRFVRTSLLSPLVSCRWWSHLSGWERNKSFVVYWLDCTTAATVGWLQSTPIWKLVWFRRLAKRPSYLEEGAARDPDNL
jgi:hypothetical protein